jgi:hypothetical protein
LSNKQTCHKEDNNLHEKEFCKHHCLQGEPRDFIVAKEEEIFFIKKTLVFVQKGGTLLELIMGVRTFFYQSGHKLFYAKI